MKLNELLRNYGDIEITEEQENELKDKLGIKESKSWKPKVGEVYYYVSDCGEVISANWFNENIHIWRYEIGNCFKTVEEAEFAVEKLKVIAELKRFAEDNNEYKIDWKDEEQRKWCIKYDYGSKEIHIDRWFTTKYTTVCFTSPMIAKQAILAIGEDRIKKYYFEVEE